MKLASKAGPTAYDEAVERVKEATEGPGPLLIPASRSKCYFAGMSMWTSGGRLVQAHREVKEDLQELFSEAREAL